MRDCTSRGWSERLVRYMTRCPFSLFRLVKVTASGHVMCTAEKDACRAFPDPPRDELARGPHPRQPDLGHAHLPADRQVEKILRHCGLWCPAASRTPPDGDLRVYDPDND